MPKYIKEPEREINVLYDADVIVCGGGPAGVCAAIAAARSNKKVVLIEQYGFLGGAMTVNAVNGVGSWYYDLDGRPLISGIAEEIIKKVTAAGDRPQDLEVVNNCFKPLNEKPDYINNGNYFYHVDPEYVKIVLDEMIEEAHITLLLHTSVVLPIMDGENVYGVFVESKNGREAILGKVVVDCTGDGDIAARCGCAYEMGRKADGACQPMSMIFETANTNPDDLWAPKGDPELYRLEHERRRYEGAVKLARERGEIKYNPNDIFCASTKVNLEQDEIRLNNFTRIQNCLAIDAVQLTKAEIMGRKQVHEAINFMRKYMKKCENAMLVATPAAVGVRESRRITGEYVLTGKDVETGAPFDDCICRGIYTLDIHNPTEVGKPSVLKNLKQPYDIPYRCLVPKTKENLLVAGRCISGDEVAMSSYRIMSHCMVMGEASGTAAALAVDEGVAVRNIDVQKLRKILAKNGVNVGMGLDRGE